MSCSTTDTVAARVGAVLRIISGAAPVPRRLRGAAALLSALLGSCLLLIAALPASADTQLDPNGLYGGCFPPAGFAAKQNHVLAVGKSLENVVGIDVIDCHEFDGGGPTFVVDCPAGSPFTYCLFNDNDGLGNHVFLGVIERTKEARDPNGVYGGCAYDTGFRRKSELIQEVGESLQNVVDVDVIDCHAFDGPGGTHVVSCPAGIPYSYCLQNQNDGAGNAVTLGVIEKHPEISKPTGSYGHCGLPGAGVRPKSDHVIAAGKSLANVTAIDVIFCGDPDGDPGTVVAACPARLGYTYCLLSHDDGVGNRVMLGVVETKNADLTLTAQDAPDPVGIGDKLTYTLTATNHGPAAASGVTVTDTLPGAASLLGATASQGSGCTHTSAVPVTATCSLGTLASGQSATVRINVRPTAPGTLVNRASIHGSGTPDPLAGNNAVKVTTNVLDRLVFVSHRDGNNEIYTMLSDGSQQKRLTTNPADDREPAWSPDRKRIAFVSHRDGNDELYVMNADGSHQTRLTTTPASEQMPAWSPDGKQLAFASNRDGNLEIYVMPSTGGPATRLTTAKGDDKSPAWSPDGTKIAFTSRRDGGNPEIYVMHADGSHQARLTFSAADDKNPSWSPDGTKLAFSSNRDGNDEIYVMHADGTSQTRLTRNGASEVQAAWSPDGTKIAFTSTRDGNQELYVMKADGTGQTRLTRNAAADFWPDWQPRPRRTIGSAVVDEADGVSAEDAALAP